MLKASIGELKRLFSITLTIMVAAVGFALYAINLSLMAQEQLYVDMSEEMMGKLVEYQQKQLARQVVDYAWWDDTAQFVMSGDTEWAAKNIGEYLRDTFDFDFTLVVGAASQLFYFSPGERGEGLDVGALIDSPEMQKLFAEAAASSAGASSEQSPAAAAGILTLGDALLMVATAPIVPDYSELPAYGRDHFLVAGLVLDRERLEEFADRLKLQGLQRTELRVPGYGYHDLVAPSGTYITSLRWDIVPTIAIQNRLWLTFLVFTAVIIVLAGALLGAMYALARRFAERAVTDDLTGLYNRRHFSQIAESEMRRNLRADQCVGFLLIDIDHFKRFNDTFGHQQGDEALRRIARALSVHLQRAGDLVFRLGGEEFCILLPARDAAEVWRMSERVRTAVERVGLTHPANDDYGVVTISVGAVAVFPDGPACSLTVAYREADRALYAAKDAGRNRTVVRSLRVGDDGAVSVASLEGMEEQG